MNNEVEVESVRGCEIADHLLVKLSTIHHLNMRTHPDKKLVVRAMRAIRGLGYYSTHHRYDTSEPSENLLDHYEDTANVRDYRDLVRACEKVIDAFDAMLRRRAPFNSRQRDISPEHDFQ